MTYSIQPVSVAVRPLNSRLWFLERKRLAGTITPMESVELDCLSNAIETGQDLTGGESGE